MVRLLELSPKRQLPVLLLLVVAIAVVVVIFVVIFDFVWVVVVMFKLVKWLLVFISRVLFKITVVWRLLQTMYLRGGTSNCVFLYGCSNIEPSSFIVRSFIYQPTSLPPLTTGCYHKNLHVSNLYTIIHPWMVAGNQLHSYCGAETLPYFSL